MSAHWDTTPPVAAKSSGRATCAAIGALTVAGIAMAAPGAVTVMFVIAAILAALCAVPLLRRINADERSEERASIGEPPGK